VVGLFFLAAEVGGKGFGVEGDVFRGEVGGFFGKEFVEGVVGENPELFAAGAAGDPPAGEEEDGVDGERVRGAAGMAGEEGTEEVGVGAGLADGVGVEGTVGFGEEFGFAVVGVKEFGLGALGRFGPVFGFDGEDAGGSDEDVVDVEVGVAGVGVAGEVVKDAVAEGGAMVVEVLGGVSFAAEAGAVVSISRKALRKLRYPRMPTMRAQSVMETAPPSVRGT
jgi:hypothetical protein